MYHLYHHLIYTNTPNFDDYKEYLREQYPDEEGYTDEDRYEIMYQESEDSFNCEKVNLDKELGNNIVMLASLGLWNGVKEGFKVLDGTNLNDVLSGTIGAYVTWYVRNGDIQCEDIHHDGTNYYIYRVLKPEYNKFEFEEYAAEHGMREASAEMTEPLGHYIADLYGYKLEDTYDE